MTSALESEVLDLMGIGLSVHDAAGAVVRANAAGRDAAATPASALVTRDGAPLPAAEHPLAVALTDDRGVRDVVLGYPRGDGRRWLAVSAFPRRADDGTRSVLCTYTDVSEPEARVDDAVSATARSNQRFEAAVRALHEGLVIRGDGGHLTYANPAASRILIGTRPMVGAEVAATSWSLVDEDGTRLAPEDLPVERTARTGEPCENVVLGVAPPGEAPRRWIRVSSACIAGPGDTSAGVVATFADVTDLRAAQADALEAHERLRRVTEAIPGVIYQYFVNDDGSFAFPFAAGMTREFIGLTPEEIRRDGDLGWSRMHDDDRERVQTLIARSQATLEVFDDTFRITDGQRWRHVRVRGAPERVSRGTLWTAIMLDVTGERELSEALRRSQRREAMGDLAAGLAHNLNNMLAAVLPNIEEAQASPSDAAALLSDAASATRRAADLVRQLLYIARGDTRSQGETCDLGLVADDVVALCRRIFDPSIALRLSRAPGPARVRGSAAHLQQVLLNLCLNARDAVAGVADARIDVRLGGDAARVTLSVEDNGCGMDAATLQRLGDLFFTTKEPGRGTGLGLATVLQTLRDVDGTLDVRSEPGRGAAFAISVPRVDAPGAGDAGRP